MEWIALAANVIGVALLHRAWSVKGQLARLFATAGWLSLATSFALWSAVSGWEYAAVYVCIATAILAWITILRQRQSRPRAVDSRPRHPARWPGERPYGRVLVRVAVSGPLAFLASATAGLLSVEMLPGDPADRLAFGCFGFLMAWASFGVWVAAVDRLRVPAVVLTGLIAGNIVLLAFVPSP